MAKPTAQQLETIIKNTISEKLLEILIPNEWNIISLFWNDTNLYLSHKIDPSHFSDNNARVYYIIGAEIVKEGKTTITDIEAGLYLQKHNKLKDIYEKAGGYNTIDELATFINKENIDGYINEFNKYFALLKLNESGWIQLTDLKKFIDMPASQIYDFYTAKLNDTFIKADTGVKSYDISDHIDDMIIEADSGAVMGLPLHGVPILNEQIGGWRKAEVVLMGAISNMGKSTVTWEMIIPSMLKHDEKLLIILNEQNLKKMQREILTILINNKFGHKFNKSRFKQGNFSDEEKMWLQEASDYLKELKAKHIITIVPLKTYHVETVIKLCRKYKSLGVDYVVLDTFKPSNDSDDFIRDLIKDSVKLYDCIKEEGTNQALWLTYQLTTNAINKRHLTFDDLGKSKQVNEICSTIILFRNMLMDERNGGSKAVRIIKQITDNSKQEFYAPVEDIHTKYQVFYNCKNREGETSESFQIVCKNDMGHNKIEEIGICMIPRDNF